MFHTSIYATLTFFRHLRTAVAVALAVTTGLFAILAFPVEPAEAQTIGPGETWTIDPGETVNGGTVVNDGTINNYGTINIDATFHNRATLNNYGTINIFGFSSLWNDHGTINNYGEINNHDIIFNDGGTINNFGTITNICANLLGSGALNGNPIIIEPCIYSLDLFEDADPSDLVLDLGQEARAVAETNHFSVAEVEFTWIDPSGNVDATIIVQAPQLKDTRQAEDTFTPDEVGIWTVEARFAGGEIVVQTLNVNFLVIPESPIGVAALMGSALAALGGYVLLKRRQDTGFNRSLDGLGS
jgi:hypothetical protein